MAHKPNKKPPTQSELYASLRKAPSATIEKFFKNQKAKYAKDFAKYALRADRHGIADV